METYKCKGCDIEFIPVRSDALFHSPSCRASYHKNLKKERVRAERAITSRADNLSKYSQIATQDLPNLSKYPQIGSNRHNIAPVSPNKEKKDTSFIMRLSAHERAVIASQALKYNCTHAQVIRLAIACLERKGI